MEEAFSYTDRPKIIHIHGTASSNGSDIVLGVDDVEQLSLKFPLSEKGKRTFIKPTFNSIFDRNKVKETINLIDRADVICIFGMSLGDFDLMWRNLLIDYLCNYDDTHIFMYQFDLSKKMGLDYDEKMDLEEERKKKIFSKWNIPHESKYLDRFHIPCGRNLFDIDYLIKEGQSKEPSLEMLKGTRLS